MDLLILSFGELSETQMVSALHHLLEMISVTELPCLINAKWIFSCLKEFSVDLYMGQFWQDPRLGFGINQSIILSGDATDKLWVPDTFIINSIDTKIHKLVSINKKAWIHLQNGTIMLVLR